MVIIITGATHTGKTRLAQKLLERYHYPCLSIDLLACSESVPMEE